MSNIRNIVTRAALASALDSFKGNMSRLSGLGSPTLIFQGFVSGASNINSEMSELTDPVYFDRSSRRFIAKMSDVPAGFPSFYFATWPGYENYGVADDNGVKPLPGKSYFCVADQEWYTPDAVSGDLVKIDPIVSHATFFDDILVSLGVPPVGASGLYSLNGISDLTYKQMVDIAAGRLDHDMVTGFYCRNTAIRTYLPPNTRPSSATQADYIFYLCTNLEVVNVEMLVPTHYTFAGCPALRKISCYSPNVNTAYVATSFQGCTALVDLDFWSVYQQNIWLGDPPCSQGLPSPGSSTNTPDPNSSPALSTQRSTPSSPMRPTANGIRFSLPPKPKTYSSYQLNLYIIWCFFQITKCSPARVRCW